MGILKLIFRKMMNNRWLTGSLFLGLLITVALVSSIPTYTSGVLQKLLTAELEDYQVRMGEFPGEFSFTENFSITNVENPAEVYSKVEKIQQEIVEDTGVSVMTEVNLLGTKPLKTIYEEEERRSDSQRSARLLMLTGIEDKITLLDGKMPSETIVDGIIEVLVSELALERRSMVLDTLFIVGDEEEHQFLVKPVGVFEQKTDENVYWSLAPQSLSEDFIVPEKIFRDEFLKHYDDILGYGMFSTGFDYHEITDVHIPKLVRLDTRVKREVSRVKEESLLFNFPIKSILSSYGEKGEQLTMMLWALNIPVLIMLAIYLFMISRLIVQRQLTEIAVFSSRGASRLQIIMIYLIEVSLLGLLAFILGPYIGLEICKLLGATDGFLEFVQRSALPVHLSSKAYFYATIAVLASIIMIMVPVYSASDRSIVDHKQKIGRVSGKFKWAIVIFEFAILGVALYGLSTFNRRQSQMQALDIDPSNVMIDAELFFMPALFIIGLGLVVLRLYPLFLTLIYKIGEKYWPVSLYSAFLQVSRSSKQYQFLMLFLVMTIGMGVFSASSARTINTNLEEQIRYDNGAEVRMELRWASNQSAEVPGESSSSEDDQSQSSETEEVVYTEPPFDPITDLKHVEKAAKVFDKEGVTVAANGNSIHYPRLLAIEPKSFGEVTWFKDSLLPHHWYQYLNLISGESSAVLISKHTAKELSVKVGDEITLGWIGSEQGEFIVYGIVDYWPTYNPLERDPDNNNNRSSLVVANLPYVQNMLGLEPYEAWLKLKPDTLRADFYQDINDSSIPVTGMKDVVPRITELKNSALLLGLNGSMTLGFLISLLISFIGFLLYWILTIKSRTMQYGIYRAMGIPMPKLIGILVSEQVLTSGFACLLGITIGGLTSYLFVPLFKVPLNVAQLMPPFTVISEASDEAKIYIFALTMLVLGSAILIGFLRKIKIDQAIKLGED